MHTYISDFSLEADDFLKAVPLGYGPRGLWYHPDKPVWLVPRNLVEYSKKNFQYLPIANEDFVWVYTDDPQIVSFSQFQLPPHPLEGK